jgi:hypothetical protein
MRDEVPDDLADLPTLALALIDAEIAHHVDEASAHMHVGLEQPNIRAQCYRFGRIHGQRLRAWRWVRKLVTQEIATDEDPVTLNVKHLLMLKVASYLGLEETNAIFGLIRRHGKTLP